VPGAGTTFTVRLPATHDEWAAPAVEWEAVRA